METISSKHEKCKATTFVINILKLHKKAKNSWKVLFICFRYTTKLSLSTNISPCTHICGRWVYNWKEFCLSDLMGLFFWRVWWGGGLMSGRFGII